VHVPTGFVNQAELRDAVAQAAKALDSREVRDVRFTLGSDSDGEPSIFFGILLTPYGSHPPIPLGGRNRKSDNRAIRSTSTLQSLGTPVLL